MIPSLAKRQLEPEDIDDPTLDTQLLHGALRGLTTINLLSASAGIVWTPIYRLARRLGKKRLRVLDIATGAGDVPMDLWQKGRRAGLQLDILGVDVSERALDFGRQRAAETGADIQFRHLDVFSETLPKDFDVVMCSLFLHHLDDAAAQSLLRSMANATNHLVLVNDLRRHWWGLTLAYVAGRVLTRSSVVHVDAVRSVRAAFTMDEVRQMASAAGLQGAKISRRWPCRFLLTWERT